MAQEKGFVNNNLESVLEIQLSNGAKIECVIDTGFNGSLLLPRKFIEENSMKFVGMEEVVMVEQNTILIETAIANLIWLGEEFSLQILVSENNEALLGTQMFIDSKLEIDYKNLTVKITK